MTVSPSIWLATIFTMIIAGGLGGVFRNLHGLFVHIYDEGTFPSELVEAYYLRPFIGAIIGLFTLFLGSLITPKLQNGVDFTWTTIEGRFLYISIVLLAGFSSQEFISKMKAVSETIFGQSHSNVRYQLRILKKLREENLIDDATYIEKQKNTVNKL